MNYDLFDVAIKTVNLAMTIALAVYVWMKDNKQVTNERLTALQKDTNERIDRLRDEHGRDFDELKTSVRESLAGHASDVARLDNARRTAPTHDDLKRLHERIDEVTAAIHGLKGEFGGASATLHLIHQYLLNRP